MRQLYCTLVDHRLKPNIGLICLILKLTAETSIEVTTYNEIKLIRELIYGST